MPSRPEEFHSSLSQIRTWRGIERYCERRKDPNRNHSEGSTIVSDAKTGPQAVTDPTYKNCESAPFVYFDVASTYGMTGGSIEVELAARTLIPMPGDRVGTEVLCTGRLRCSPAAAVSLRDTLDAALKLYAQAYKQAAQNKPPGSPEAAPRLN
jgi:hypothetical protein